MRQATEIRRHQESNKTRAKQPEGHDGRDPGTEFVQKQRSISDQRDEDDDESWCGGDIQSGDAKMLGRERVCPGLGV